MKTKRILSMVLAIVLAVSLFAGVTGTAYADGETITHTVTSGQSLYKICKSYGLTYDTCKNAIMILNDFNSQTQLNRIYPGQKIILPASDALAATVRTEIVIGNNSSSSSSSSASSTSSTTTTTTTSSNSDSVAYYLVSHTVQIGETLSSICKDLGSSYSQYANTILTINGISNPTHIYAGKTIYIPVGTQPSGSYYTIVSHRVVSGETMSAICTSYGINYSTNKNLISGLNDGANLSTLKIGQVVYVPTTKTVTSSSTSTSSTTGIAYAINISKTGNESGFAYATVNGSVVSVAAAGTTVTMVASTSTSTSMKIESVLRADNKATIKFDEETDSFTMPNCAVEVVVSFEAGLAINAKIVQDSTTKANNGTFDTYINDTAVRFAAPGKTITIKTSPAEGYVTSSVEVLDDNGKNQNRSVEFKKIANNTYTFKMPSYSPTVQVTFGLPTNYETKLYFDEDYAKAGSKNGTSSTMGTAKVLVDGSEVSRVAADTVVTVKAEPNSGYAVKTVKYTAADGSTLLRATKLSDNEWTFVMPDYAKAASKINKVVVIFERNDSHTINTYAFCPVTCYVWDDKDTDETTDDVLVTTNTAKPGQEVYVSVSNTSGYLGSIDNIKYGNGTPVEFESNVKINGVLYYEFTMPAADVTITTKLTKDDLTRYSFSDWGSDISYNTYLKDSKGNLTLQTAFAEGDTVVVKPTDSKRTAKVYTFGSKWDEVPDGTFRMPACTVAIKVTADAQKVATITSSANEEYGSLVIYSDGVEIANSVSETSGEIYVGNKVTFVTTTVSDKHVLEKIVVYKNGVKQDKDPMSYADGYPIDEATSYIFEAVYSNSASKYSVTYDTLEPSTSRNAVPNAVSSSLQSLS